MKKETAIIILTWNAGDIALQCLHTLAHQQQAPDTVLVVDNASSDGTPERIAQQFPAISLMRNSKNLGFSAGMNIGIRALQAKDNPPDIVVLLNQDTLLAPEWLSEIVAPFADNPDVGAVGCKLLYHNGTIQHAGAYLDWPRAVAHHVGNHEPDKGQYDEAKPYDFVTGAALALRMTALHDVGLLDQGYTPAYYEDTDLCWRMRQHNYRIMYAPKAIVTHHESLSLKDELQRSKYYNRGRLRFVLKSYALPDILGPFAENELAFIRKHGHAMEERVLRWAYLETLGNLNDILQARSTYHPSLSAAETQDLVAMLLACKDAVKLSLYNRAYATIDAFYAL